MGQSIEALEILAEHFGKMEGVGRKSAARMAYAVLDMTDEEAQAFADAILNAKAKIHRCPICQNLTDLDICPICSDPNRDQSTICVVAEPKTVNAFERVREYRGVYHVLGGLISPIAGITPDDLKLKELVQRVADGHVSEVIVATNPTIEGETTARYLAKLLKPFDVKVSRLAYGVPVGSDLELTDEVTLTRAIQGRQIVEE
ncbi:MAG: recombination protein RecR [Clostridia bacterium]|nr:recombination protein RecR [Clostridia bacterium]